jgi:FkbM family methyltransferase
MFAYLAVDCVLDVGANTGQYAQMLREYSGYKGRIISFEPTPEVFRVLEQNSRHDSLWQVRGVALGNTSGIATFRTTATASVGNSFLPMVKEDAGHLQFVDVTFRCSGFQSFFLNSKESMGFQNLS